MPNIASQILPEFMRPFSWIAATRYKGKDPEAATIKAKAKERILNRLGNGSKNVPTEQVDFMLSVLYSQLKIGDSQKVEDSLVSKLSDPQFSFSEFVAEKLSAPAHIIEPFMEKFYSQQSALNDYEPDIEDFQIQLKVLKPPKGTDIQHFTEILPEEVRVPLNILELLPDNALCVSNLPLSNGVEVYRKLFSKYGEIQQCSLIKDINRTSISLYNHSLGNPMYVVLAYADVASVAKAKKLMNNYFLESSLLKVKVSRIRFHPLGQ